MPRWGQSKWGESEWGEGSRLQGFSAAIPAPSAVLARMTGHGLVAVIVGPIASLARVTHRALAAIPEAMAGALATSRVYFREWVAGTVAVAGSLGHAICQNLNATIVSVNAGLARLMSKALVATTLSANTGLSKSVARLVEATVEACSAVLVTSRVFVRELLAATVAGAVTLGRLTNKVFRVAVGSPDAALARGVARTLAAVTVAWSAVRGRQWPKALSGASHTLSVVFAAAKVKLPKPRIFRSLGWSKSKT